MNDSFDLNRFLQAQENCYPAALAELRAGRKTSHWMWFVFPQIEGLGLSPTARRYAIRNIAEARAYLEHPVLGARLRECTEATLRVENRTLSEIFGHPDDLKFCSSMTLFEYAAEDREPFTSAIARYCGGQRDLLTLGSLGVTRI